MEKTQSHPAPNTLVSDLDDSDSSIDPEDFAEEYVSLNTRLYHLRPQLFDQPRNGGKKPRGRANADDTDPKTRRLQLKIAKIKSDILFDRDTAEIKWLEKLNDLRRESAFVREKERAATEKIPDKSVQPTVPEDTGDFVVVESAESDEEALLGGMFAENTIDEPPPDQHATNVSIVIRNFGESVGGTSPRKLLQEVCQARQVLFPTAHMEKEANGSLQRSDV